MASLPAVFQPNLPSEGCFVFSLSLSRMRIASKQTKHEPFPFSGALSVGITRYAVDPVCQSSNFANTRSLKEEHQSVCVTAVERRVVHTQKKKNTPRFFSLARGEKPRRVGRRTYAGTTRPGCLFSCFFFSRLHVRSFVFDCA